MLKFIRKTVNNALPVITRPEIFNGNHYRNVKCTRVMCTSQPQLAKKEVEVIFIRANGERIQVKGKVGENLLDVVHNSGIDIDGFGACDGTLTCSTCHLILKQEQFDALPDRPSVEERDMLDLATDLTSTSRLGCQVILSEDMKSLEVTIPATIIDAR